MCSRGNHSCGHMPQKYTPRTHNHSLEALMRASAACCLWLDQAHARAPTRVLSLKHTGLPAEYTALTTGTNKGKQRETNESVHPQSRARHPGWETKRRRQRETSEGIQAERQMNPSRAVLGSAAHNFCHLLFTSIWARGSAARSPSPDAGRLVKDQSATGDAPLYWSVGPWPPRKVSHLQGLNKPLCMAPHKGSYGRLPENPPLTDALAPALTGRRIGMMVNRVEMVA